MKSKFIGVWKLIQYSVIFEENKEEFFPYGKDAVGYLIYTPDHVSVHIMRSERLLKNIPIEEKIEVAENYGGYVGRYEISNDTVIHYPEVSSFVSFIQTAQARGILLSQNQLILECPYFKEQKGYSRVVWQRVET